MAKILIVDDSVTVRQQVGIAVDIAGFEAVEAEDGIAALEAVAQGGIALIICDVIMPRMNGLEFVETLHRDARYAHLPVVMLTVDGQLSVVKRAKSAGVKGWIIKPFKVDLMIAAIHKLIGK